MTPHSWRDVIAVHPAADLFPMLNDTELDEMAADIAANNNSLINPISLWHPSPEAQKLVLLDGRNRADALERLALPLFREDGQPSSTYFCIVGADPAFDPIAFIISANIRRRDLDPSQRAMIAAIPSSSTMRSQGIKCDIGPRNSIAGVISAGHLARHRPWARAFSDVRKALAVRSSGTALQAVSAPPSGAAQVYGHIDLAR